jgi:hypothetical protein
MFLHWSARNGPRPNLVNAQAIAGDTLLVTPAPTGDYHPTDKLGGGILSAPAVTPLSYVRFQPGMPRRGAYLFDVPVRALAGAHLYLSDRDVEADPLDGVHAVAGVGEPLGIGRSTSRRSSV